MEERGLEVHAISAAEDALSDGAAPLGLTLHTIPMTRRMTPLRDLVALVRLYRRLRRLKPAIVHGSTPKAGLLAMIASVLTGVPIRLYHMRGLPLETATGWRRAVLTAAERLSCRLAHRVICVSDSLRRVAIGEALCPAGRIVVPASGSSNGVDATGRFNPDALPPHARARARRAHGICEEDVVVGFLGRIARDKGVEELYRAWCALRPRLDRLHLLIVGPPDSTDPIPPAVLADLERDPRVHLVGFSNDAPLLYAAMDVLALPSHREGFPNVVLEASAMRLPVVATRIPGCVDAVIDGVTGSLVPPRDPDALAAALAMYASDAVLRARHGEAGRGRVLERFRRDVVWEALYREYEALLERRGVRARLKPASPV